jgi:hypothetical protein
VAEQSRGCESAARKALEKALRLDPAKDVHIHSVRLEFISPNEVRASWIGWPGGKPADPVTKLHLKRRKVQA